jgi:hypothetical protein
LCYTIEKKVGVVGYLDRRTNRRTAPAFFKGGMMELEERAKLLDERTPAQRERDADLHWFIQQLKEQPAPVLRIYQDGDRFFAAPRGFVDLQESEVYWFPEGAVEAILLELGCTPGVQNGR